jgi:hypothetical protein
MPKNKHKNYTRKCKDFRKPLDTARISRKPYYNAKRVVFKGSRKITIKGSRQTKKHKPKYIGGLSKDTDENIINELKSIVAGYIAKNPEFKNAQPNMLSVIKKLTTDSSASSDPEVELDPDVKYFDDIITKKIAPDLTQPDLDILQKLAIRIIDENDLSFVGKGLKYLQDFISACVLYFINDIELNDSTEFLFRTRITNKMPYVTVKRMKDGSEAVYDVNEMFALIKEELKDGTAYESKVKENLLKKITIDSNFGLETVEKGDPIVKPKTPVSGVNPQVVNPQVVNPPVVKPSIVKQSIVKPQGVNIDIGNTVNVTADTKIYKGDEVTFKLPGFFSKIVTGTITYADNETGVYTIEETITKTPYNNISKAQIKSIIVPKSTQHSTGPSSTVTNPPQSSSSVSLADPPVNSDQSLSTASPSVTSHAVSKPSNVKPEKGFAEGNRVSFINDFMGNRVFGKNTDIQEFGNSKVYTILGDNPEKEYSSIREYRLRHEGPAAVAPAVGKSGIRNLFGLSKTENPSKQTEIVANPNDNSSTVNNNTSVSSAQPAVTPAVGKSGIRNLLSFSSNVKPPNPQSDDQMSSSASASDPTVSSIDLSNDNSPKFKSGESVTFKTEKGRLSFSKKGTINGEPTFNEETGFVYDIKGADTKIYTAIKEELIESASPTVVNSSKKPPTQTFVSGNKVSFKSGIVPFSKTVTGEITEVFDNREFNPSSEILYDIADDANPNKIHKQIEGKKLTLVNSVGGGLRRSRRNPALRRTRRNPSLRRTPERGTKQDFLRMKRSK